MTSPAQPNTHAPEFEDIQGLVRFAFKHHTEACFLLLKVRDPGLARKWLRTAPVTNAVESKPRPRTVLQVALSAGGVRALQIGDDILSGFSLDFVAGMASDASRARRLGDVGINDWANWHWGTAERLPDLAVLLYALPGELLSWRKAIEAQWQGAFDAIACLDTSDMRGREPFGFVDGISQPQLDWSRTRAVGDTIELDDPPLACLGEFLLGYPNEYGLYTPRPLLDVRSAAADALPRAEECTDMADLGRNGSYLVVRQLVQDVPGFWRAIDRYVAGDKGRRLLLAQAMVGRTLDGDPLVGARVRYADDDSGASADPLNDFNFDADPNGWSCPLGAHIRRANPRNADFPPGTDGFVRRLTRTLGLSADARDRDLVASTRFHRILRRGREFGEAQTIDEALHSTPSSQARSGLQFLCLCANIVRQFEFVQGAWLMNAKFNGLNNEADPLLGNRELLADGSATDAFSIQCDDRPSERVSGLPPFITVVGGAYFFLPGIRALRFLASEQR